MMLPFGCNTSQPIPNILADTFFSKNGQVKFWPDNENFGSVKKKIDYFSLTARSQQKRTMLVSTPTSFWSTYRNKINVICRIMATFCVAHIANWISWRISDAF